MLGILDVSLGHRALPGFEELLNARAGVLVACGHGDRLFALQYRNFCGGCSADALLAAPLLRALGPRLIAWKLVPIGFHTVTVGALVALAGRAGGLRAGALAAALLLGAPAAWRELAFTGWGNHAESAAFTFTAALLASHAGRRWWFGAAAGLVAGLGLWYAWISAHALPALLVVVTVAGGPRALGAFLLALPVGALPLGAFQATRPSARAEALGLALQIHPAQGAGLLSHLSAPFRPGRLWPHGDGLLRLVGGGVACALGALGLGGALLGLARRPTHDRAALLLPALALAGLLVAFALRQDLWEQTAPLYGYDPFELRYRAPALPLLVLGAALLGARGRVALVAAGLVAGFGLVERVRGWEAPAGRLDRPLAVVDLAPDPTLPEGDPPRRNPRKMGRPQDLRAAEAWLSLHTDPLPVCEEIHAWEVGRRVGLWVRDGRPAGAPAWADATCERPPQIPGLDAAAVEAGWRAGCR